ncbi:triphosphoribosyl-dephospho-CoA synthase [Eubacteriales bacterium OttesenSCG-928-N13]|nr:triphosphoribosyl-dephospho-CoA synthase [Eubacteriales bacterium OttesenSCG-928-N13]
MVMDEISLNEMLAARDWRADRQRAHRLPGHALICLTLNIPGGVKRLRYTDQTFEMAKRWIMRSNSEGHYNPQLLEKCAERAGPTDSPDPVLLENRVDRTGHFAMFRTALDPMQRKQDMVQLEQHPLGALLDIDVLDDQGHHISRQDLGLPGRRCLVCEQDAHACARNRTHPVEQLQSAVQSMLDSYWHERFARWIEQCATGALLRELDTTPKPGLVDRANNGAHDDMDYALFLRSIDSLSQHFYHFAMLGLRACDIMDVDHNLASAPPKAIQDGDSSIRDNPQDIGVDLDTLIALGKRADADMMQATGGPNTHRGAIFTLGLLSTAAGWLLAQDMPMTQNELLDAASHHARTQEQPIEQGELPDATINLMRKQNMLLDAASRLARSLLSQGKLPIHGGGASQQAMAGFPALRAIALPMLREHLSLGRTENDAGVITLLHLMAELPDSNLLARSDQDTLHAIQRELRQSLAQPGDPIELSRHWDERLIRMHLSPGGCADLLAAAWMVTLLCTKEDSSHAH